MIIDSLLVKRRAALSVIQSRYKTTYDDDIGTYSDKLTSKAYKEWQKASTKEADDTGDKIAGTLNDYVEYLKSEDSPFAESERESPEFSGLIEAIKPEGLLHQDLKDKKYNSSGLKTSFMKHFTSFMRNVSGKAKEGHPDKAKTALSIFPPQQQSEYNCVDGARARVVSAERQLVPAQEVALTTGYDESTLPFALAARKTVPEGNQVHISPAIDYLMGVDHERIKSVDRFYHSPITNMSATKAWEAYRATTDTASQTKERILLESQDAVSDNDPDNNIIVTPQKQERYLDAWGISDIMQSFYDDDYKLKRKHGADKSIAKGMNDSLNQYAFGEDKSQYLDWLSSPDTVVIPDSRQLSTKAGGEWINEQLKAIINENGKVEDIKQEAVLMALFIFSEGMEDNKPAIALKAIHDLGGGGKEGISKGLGLLSKIKEDNPQYSGVIDRINDRCDYYCRDSINSQDQTNQGIKEYADYLQNSQENPPEYLLHAMIAGGAANEEIIDIINHSGIDLNKKDGCGRKPAYYAGEQLNAEVLDALRVKEADCSMVKEDGTTPMHYAAYTGKVEAMEWLHSQDPSLIGKESKDGTTPMHDAAREGKVEAMEWLHSQDPSLIGKERKDGSTPMHYASYTGKVEAMEWLHSQDPSLIGKERKNGSTPMHYAAHAGKVEAMEWLHSQDPSLIGKERKDGSTPMHDAAREGKVEAIKFALGTENISNFIDKVSKFQRRTALSKASSKGHTSTVEALVQAGANKNIWDWRGRTSLNHAMRNNNNDIAEILRR